MEQKDFFSQIKGSQSLSFQKPPYILASGNDCGKEGGAKAHWEKNLM